MKPSGGMDLVGLLILLVGLIVLALVAFPGVADSLWMAWDLFLEWLFGLDVAKDCCRAAPGERRAAAGLPGQSRAVARPPAGPPGSQAAVKPSPLSPSCAQFEVPIRQSVG